MENLIEIFGAAVEKSGAEQTRFLEQACIGNDELRQRVDELLEAYQDAGDNLEQLTNLDPETMIDLSAGTEVDDFRIEKLVGIGGFGIVYRCKQMEPMQRLVAMKVIRPELACPNLIARFEMERQSLAQLNHTNVAQIYGGGITECGLPYIAMEYIEGCNVIDYCRTKALPLEKRLDLFRDICRGLGHAHHRGIIHRDIKPSNILVTETDGKPVPKLIDFGVAANTSLPAPGKLTLARQLVGTPEYMSPEQAGFDSGNVDLRSDLYSMGILLYELLTSKTPFATDSSTGEELPVGKVLEQVCTADPPSPNQLLRRERKSPVEPDAAESSVMPGKLPRELDWIVMKAISKQPDDRYQNSQEFEHDLTRYFQGEPVLAAPKSYFYGATKKLWKHRYAAIIATAIFSLLSWAFYSVNASTQVAKAQAKQKEQMFGMLESIFLTADMTNGENKQTKDVLDDAFHSFESRLAGDVESQDRFLELMGRIYSGYSQPQRYLEIIEKRAALPPHRKNPNLQPVELSFANAYYQLGQQARAAEIVKEALPELREEFGVLHRFTNRAEHLFATSTMYSEPEHYLERMKRAYQNGVDGDLDLIGDFLTYDLAIAYIEAGELDVAEDMLNEAIPISKKVFGEKSIHTLELKKLLGRVLPPEADNEPVRLLESSLADSVEVFGEDHRTTLQNMNTLAYKYSEAGQHDKAIALAKDLIQRRTNKSGKNHPWTFHTRMTLIHCSENSGDMDEAIRLSTMLCEDLNALHTEISSQGKTPNKGLTTMAANQHAHLSKRYTNTGDLDSAKDFIDKAFEFASVLDTESATYMNISGFRQKIIDRLKEAP